MFRRLKDRQRSPMPVEHKGEASDVVPRKDPALTMASRFQDDTKISFPPSGDPRPKLARAAAKLAKPVDSVVTVKRGEGRKMVVGREICLSGEIKSCDTLVVEGRVEADLSDCRSLEVLASGFVKGNATVDRCEISGRFEGNLIARQHLLLRATGHILGSVTYEQLEVERGGRISGQMTDTDGSAIFPEPGSLGEPLKERAVTQPDRKLSTLEGESTPAKSLQVSV